MNVRVVLRILLVMVIVGPALTACDPVAQKPLEQRLQAVLDRGIRRHKAHGVSAAVVFPDQSVWTGVSGISHDDVPIGPDMLFAIGSITKNVVATLVLQLAEEGALTLDDPISRWLPAYRHVDPNITIRQLLSHTSGIYMFWENQRIWDELKADRTRIWTPEEVLSYIEEPYFAPGDGYRYSNTNYLLLAMIVEEVTGSSLSGEFRERFWQTLGMENTFLSQEEEIPDNQAHVYGDNFNQDGSNIDLTFLPRVSHESIGYGSSGLFMTAQNLARWSHALFGGELLQQRSMDEMLDVVEFRPHANMRAYGLGVEAFVRQLSSGKEAVGHAGGNIGTTAYMVYLPDSRVSVAVMANAFPNQTAEAVTKGLIRTVLRELDAIGPIPYFEFFPYGIIVIGATSSLVGILVTLRRRRLADSIR